MCTSHNIYQIYPNQFIETQQRHWSTPTEQWKHENHLTNVISHLTSKITILCSKLITWDENKGVRGEKKKKNTTSFYQHPLPAAFYPFR